MYAVNVSAHLMTAVAVEASDAEEAEELVKKRWKEGKLQLDYDKTDVPWFNAVPMTNASACQ